jgi:hypothetical protein
MSHNDDKGASGGVKLNIPFYLFYFCVLEKLDGEARFLFAGISTMSPKERVCRSPQEYIYSYVKN